MSSYNADTDTGVLTQALCQAGWLITSGSPDAEMVLLSKTFNDVSVSVTLKNDGDAVKLHRIRSQPPSKGGGGSALAEICDTADQHDVTITLIVNPFGPLAMAKAPLVRLYEKFEFVEDSCSPDSMIRYPERPEHDMETVLGG